MLSDVWLHLSFFSVCRGGLRSAEHLENLWFPHD
jgi:hypothetical protein